MGDKMKKESKYSFQNIFQRETKLAIYIISCMVIVVLGASYALYLKVDTNSNNQVVSAGDLSFTFKEGSTISSVKNSSCFEPISDEEANVYFNACSYQFSVTNTGTLNASYAIKLIDNNSNIAPSKLKFILKKQNNQGVLETIKSGFVSELSNSIIVSDSLKRLKIEVYSIQVYVYDKTYTDSDSSLSINYTIDGTGFVNENTYSGNAKQSISEEITELASKDTANLATDEAGNTRYIGKNPNNYVSVDGELWRIVGVFKNVKNNSYDTKAETRVKLVRSESIGSYSWDTSESSINSGTGVNNWSDSDLMKLLNDGYGADCAMGQCYDALNFYWASSSGKCYINANNITKSCDFSSNGMKESMKKLIGSVSWNIGAIDNLEQTPNSLYNNERGTKTYKMCTSGDYCNDGNEPDESSLSWTAKVGLLYPSDYGYATSGGSGVDRATCLNTALSKWNDNSVSDCKNNNWLLYSSNYSWSITPFASTTNSNKAVAFSGKQKCVVESFNYETGQELSKCNISDQSMPGKSDEGTIKETNVSDSIDVRPVVYLSSDIVIVSGDGSENNPYQISKKEENIANEITTIASHDSTNLATDDYGNIRYIGKDPNNYVSFDGELWRIVGLMQNVMNYDKKAGTHVKLIRNESIGSYSWDTSASSINGGYGVNEWSQSKLMKLLNTGYSGIGGSLYYESGKGNCYTKNNNGYSACDFTSSGMKDSLIDVSDNVYWNTGSNSGKDYSNDTLTYKFFDYERKGESGKICTSGGYCNDKVARTTSWYGKVGLLSPSDLGYATGGDELISRTSCLETPLDAWVTEADSCYQNNNWLYKDNYWMLNPSRNETNATYVYNCGTLEERQYAINSYEAYKSLNVYPVVYLVENVKISKGEGTKDNPYEISLIFNDYT